MCLFHDNSFISVIIPVFNDKQHLFTCLKALQFQTYDYDLYEVIVVDNGSDENISEVTNKYERVIYAYEDHIGSYAARNKGISIAKGNIIAFTDADCIPEPDWIEKGVANLLSMPDCGLVAGKINVYYNNPECPTAVELYDGLMFGYPQKAAIEKERYGLTANIFTFRSVIDKVGVFDSTLKSTGDYEWGQRVFFAGYKQIYAEDTCVNHPARVSFNELHKRIIRIVGGRYDIKKNHSSSFSELFKDLVELGRGFLPPRKDIARIWLDKRIKENKQKIQLIFILTFLKYATAWEKIRLSFGGKSTRG